MTPGSSGAVTEGGGALRFHHRAMATEFEIMIAGEASSFAAGAARAAFEEIDRIEQELSRYAANSDITRINNLGPHGTARVGIHAFECLRLSRLYWEETGGAFDVTLGSLMECWVARDKSLRHPTSEEVAASVQRMGMGNLTLDQATMSVRVGTSVPLIDLGAVGKGYAVDRVVDLLKEWGVRSALVHGGMSSVYAFGRHGDEPGWPVTLSDPEVTSDVIERVVLSDMGLGGSGIKKGMHIIDPRSGRPTGERRATWVMSESAARSDALSTACMVMSEEEIQAMVSRDSRLRAIIAVSRNGGEIHPPGEDGAEGISARAAHALRGREANDQPQRTAGGRVVKFGAWTPS